MAFYKYPNKDKFVKIFKISKKRRRIEGRSSVIVEKEYLHPVDQAVRAYIRQISASERFTSDAHQDSRDYEVVINYRPDVTVDCYIEYKGSTFKITGVDGYELKEAELKLRVHEQSPDEDPLKVSGKEWEVK